MCNRSTLSNTHYLPSSYLPTIVTPQRLVIRQVVCCRLTLSQRGEHDIDDELVFSNHTGYIFHDSPGIESGGTEELDIVKGFIQRKAGASRLKSRLHAIWFGVLCVNDDD